MTTMISLTSRPSGRPKQRSREAVVAGQPNEEGEIYVKKAGMQGDGDDKSLDEEESIGVVGEEQEPKDDEETKQPKEDQSESRVRSNNRST